MPTYAANTDVTSDRSRAEIEKNLRRFGASSFAYGWDEGRAVVMFKAHDRHIRFVLPMPDRNAAAFRFTPARKYERTKADQEKAYEQAVRQRWRALNLAILAKLEAVEASISTFESEFMAFVVLPNGQTVGDMMSPQIEEAYQSGLMPSGLMPMLESGETK